MEQKMFCYQCQETAGYVAAMQDLLVYVTKGISAVTTALRQEGRQVSAEINHLITMNLFTTVTNANFGRESIEARIRATLTEKEFLLAFLSPNVTKVLVDNFGIAGIGTVEEDIKLFFGTEH